jgi:hypothetical protein
VRVRARRVERNRPLEESARARVVPGFERRDALGDETPRALRVARARRRRPRLTRGSRAAPLRRRDARGRRGEEERGRGERGDDDDGPV